MISPDWCRLMAAYNAEMNRRLYAAAEQVQDAQRRAPSGAFFGSLHGTLCHLVWADHAWMSRFAGWPKPLTPLKDSAAMIEGWEELCAARREADAGIVAWAQGLDHGWLAGKLTWYSASAKQELTKPRWVTVAHFFNHQTHHRGQAHCLITQAGVTPDDTDLPWIVDLEALGLA